MAWGTFNFRSKMLNMPVEAEVLIPQAHYKRLKQESGYKVLILLHGFHNDRTEWLLKSQIFDMVRELPVLVFMPSGKNCFYVNTHNGYSYMDFVSEEIPEFIRTHFRVSDKREDWLIAGASMGGYGAFVCGLGNTDTFGNIASFSGALDIIGLGNHVPELKIDQLLGPDFASNEQSNTNPFYICDRISEKDRPRVFMCCGDEDVLLSMNKRFYDRIKDNYDATAIWGSGGHDFVYWNERLKDMFVWFCPDEMKNGFFMGRCGNDFC